MVEVATDRLNRRRVPASVAAVCVLLALRGSHSAPAVFCGFCVAPPGVASRALASRHTLRRTKQSPVVVRGWNFFGGKDSPAMPGARSLPAGHTTVNASTIEQSRTEALPFVRSVSAALEHTAEALHGMSEQVASLSPEVASVYAEAANSDDVEARFSDMVSLSSLTNDDAGLLREDVYNDMIVKGAWANNIAKRVKSSPEMRATKLQLLQAQVLRAQQVATAKSQEAAAASAAATAAADKLEDLEQQLERERLAQEQRLAQERLAQAHLAQEETAREQAAREQAAHAAQSQTSLRKDVHPHNLIQQPSSKPKLVVVELEGGIFDSLQHLPTPPLEFKAPANGAAVLRDDDGVCVHVMPGALDFLEMLSREADCSIAVLCRVPTPSRAHELLQALQLGGGQSAADAAAHVVMCPVLSKSRQLSETLRATMTKSTLESLRRSTKLRYQDMVYIGPESRVCKDLLSLGICSKRTPYGLSVEAWHELMEMYM